MKWRHSHSVARVLLNFDNRFWHRSTRIFGHQSIAYYISEFRITRMSNRDRPTCRPTVPWIHALARIRLRSELGAASHSRTHGQIPSLKIDVVRPEPGTKPYSILNETIARCAHTVCVIIVCGEYIVACYFIQQRINVFFSHSISHWNFAQKNAYGRGYFLLFLLTHLKR